MILKGDAFVAARRHAHLAILPYRRLVEGPPDLERRLRIDGAADYMECPLTPEGLLVSDLVITKTMELADASMKLTTRWAPQTQVVEFYDGPYDGTVRQVQKVGEEVRCHMGPIFPTKTMLEDPDQNALLDTTTLTYRLEGWNLIKNLWAYRLDKPYMPARTKET